MYLISFITIFCACIFLINSNHKYKEISYSRLTEMIENKDVLKIEARKNVITITKQDKEKFVCKVDNTENLKQLIQNYNSQYEEKIELVYLSPSIKDLIVQWIVKNFLFVIFLIIGLYCFISLKFSDSEIGISQQIFSGEGSKPHKVNDSNKVFFDDIGGCTEAKRVLNEYMDFFKKSEVYKNMGAVKPRGILLYGEPGTGKTMLAKAAATEAECAFLYQSASSFDEMFVGLGASRIRELFAKAKKLGRCIIFIDELDALGSRSSKDSRNNQSNLQTLNELLTQMDGFDSNADILVIAATNKKENLDHALIRSGRFDTQIHVDLPNKKEREDIMNRIIKKRGIKIDPNYDLTQFSSLLNGASGADIANILNKAAMYAVREEDELVDYKHIDYALDIFELGEIKDHDTSEEEKQLTARHEAGHTLIAYSFNSFYDIYKVTIVARSKTLGMLQSLLKNQNSPKKIEYLNRIKCCLAGRISEEIYYGSNNMSCGASSDLENADQLVRLMVEKFGMFDSVFIAKEKEHISESKKAQFDQFVEQILNELYKETKDFLLKNKKALDELSNTLYEKKTLTAKEVYEILDKYNLKNETPFVPLRYDENNQIIKDNEHGLEEKNIKNFKNVDKNNQIIINDENDLKDEKNI